MNKYERAKLMPWADSIIRTVGKELYEAFGGLQEIRAEENGHFYQWKSKGEK